jgi:hypothetical protein
MSHPTHALRRILILILLSLTLIRTTPVLVAWASGRPESYPGIYENRFAFAVTMIPLLLATFLGAGAEPVSRTTSFLRAGLLCVAAVGMLWTLRLA